MYSKCLIGQPVTSLEDIKELLPEEYRDLPDDKRCGFQLSDPDSQNITRPLYKIKCLDGKMEIIVIILQVTINNSLILNCSVLTRSPQKY